MREISVGKNLTGGVKTTIYTVPTGYYAKWNLLYVSNHAGVNQTVTAAWYDSSTNTEVIVIDAYPLDPKSFLKFDGGAYVVLEEGDQIRVTSQSGSTMSCIATLEVSTQKTTSLKG